MKKYVITRSNKIIKGFDLYYMGSNLWATSPDNAIRFESKHDALIISKSLKNTLTSDIKIETVTQ